MQTDQLRYTSQDCSNIDLYSLERRIGENHYDGSPVANHASSGHELQADIYKIVRDVFRHACC